MFVLDDFWENMDIVMNILVFFILYSIFSHNFIPTKFMAAIVAFIVVLLIVIPFPWVKFLLFAIAVLGVLEWKPETW
jgi:chromate transport protein ChrA